MAEPLSAPHERRRTLAHLRAARRLRAVLPHAAGRRGAQLAAHRRGDRARLGDRLARGRSPGRTICRPGASTASRSAAKASSPTCGTRFVMVIPATHHLDHARRGRRLRDLALALPRRQPDLRDRHHRRVPAGADEADPLGAGAARPRPVEHHRRPGADPRGAGHQLHHAVLPQLLRRHSAGPDEGRARRRRRLLPHLLAHRAAALAADPDRHGDLAVHRHLERVSLRRDLHHRRAAAGDGGADRASPPRRRPTCRNTASRAPRCCSPRCRRCSSTSSAASISCAASPPAR